MSFNFGAVSAKFSVILLAALAVLPVRASAKEPERPPNIVFILADDLGINDLGCYGRKDQPTPNLDRLAGQGLRFSSAYSAASICSPTRAAILTGKSPARLKLTTFLPGRPDAVSQLLLHPDIAQRLPGDVPTLAELLRAIGYRCACIGKWHLGGKGALPTDRGFDLYHPGKALTEPSATEEARVNTTLRHGRRSSSTTTRNGRSFYTWRTTIPMCRSLPSKL